ncbi:hypothetical protein BOTNAR_1385g00010 [Botryotinia narcissicola]|uniref:Uncharacterized protein n=1 Tax=Botryotinia narcissicola TaxID=278944 RepID=A0A4Z1HFB7_9HELO|nr:hypothetical protein BOTNAR_1385g00010 [Botryotinia narcissicola]
MATCYLCYKTLMRCEQAGVLRSRDSKLVDIGYSPPVQSAIPETDVIELGSCPQEATIQSPVAPVSAEAFKSLFSVIRQDTHTLTGICADRMQKHIQKITCTVQVFFAELVLFRDQNQFLMEMNNEAKVRRSTRSEVLGKAKIISYEDIEEAQVKRTAKDAQKGKSKRGQKLKSIAIGADEDEPEPEPEVVCAARKVRKSTKEDARKHTSIA